jgi:hypothetical protein
MRDMSLVLSGYLLSKNGQLSLNSKVFFADCTFVVRFDQATKMFVMMIRQNLSAS